MKLSPTYRQIGGGWFAIFGLKQTLGRNSQGSDAPSPESVRERVLESLSNAETRVFVFESEGAVLCTDGDRLDRYEPVTGEPVVIVVTDRRIAVTVPGGADDGGDRELDLGFTDVERAGLDDPGSPGELGVRLGCGERWRLPAANVDPSALGSAVEYVQAGGDVWGRVDAAESAVVGGRDQVIVPIRGGDDWAVAYDRYEFLRTRLEDVRRTVRESRFADVEELTERLDRARAMLDRTWVRAHCYRVERWYEEGLVGFESRAINTGLEALDGARRDYRRVRRFAGTRTFADVSPVESPDDRERGVPAGVDDALDQARERVGRLLRHAIAVGHLVVDRRDDPSALELETAVECYREALYCHWVEEELVPTARGTLEYCVESTVGMAIEREIETVRRARESLAVDAE